MTRQIWTGAPRGIIAIPARLASTRLPNKLLLAETGRPLLAHVIERCLAAQAKSGGLLTRCVVAYDDERLGRVASAAGAAAVATGEHHRCGTTRIAEAVEQMGATCDFVVNVQGDEPEIDPQAILAVANELLRDPSAPMATLAIAMPPGTEAQQANPNAVKVVLDSSGRAMYFSRAAIPFDRVSAGATAPLWHHHLGVYAYRRDFLAEFARLPVSPLEERESLEQLRALEAGYPIRVAVIPEAWAGKGIDTPEDYARFVQRRQMTAAA